MPPKRKARSSLADSTPNTPTPAGHDEDSMAVDTPQTSAVDTPRTAATPFSHPKGPSEEALMQNVWTEDEHSALLSAVIIWPPKGMHRHFRILAISEHLRNRGINPDIRPHTRIPGIWKKLREFFNLEFLNEREDKIAFDGEDPQHLEEKYNDFELPEDDEYIQDLMWKRRLPSPSEAGTSPPAMDLDDPEVLESLLQQSQSSASIPDRKAKRKRGDSVAVTGRKTRSSTVEDTEEGTPVPTSSPAPKGGRGGRGRTRASTRTRAEDTEHEDSEEPNGDEEEEEESTHERATSTARHTRGGVRGRGGRGRGRPAKRGRGR